MTQQVNLDFETCLGWKCPKTVYTVFVCWSAKPTDTQGIIEHEIVFHLNHSGSAGSFADVSAPLYAVWYIETFCS